MHPTSSEVSTRLASLIISHRESSKESVSIHLSIIVVTYNGWHLLEPCLRSLLTQLHASDEIVLVDNGSRDGTAQGVAEIADSRIRYERLEENLGFAGANNVGAQRATREWLLLLNNDTIVLDGFLDALRSAARHQNQYQIFACKMIRASDRKIDNVGIAVTAPLLRQVQLRPGSDPESHTSVVEVFGASGGAMMVHRSVLDDIGLFDPRFFAYCEDVDFALRARIAGYRCAFVPWAAVLHVQSGTGSSMPGRRLYCIQRNMELAILRNLSGRDLFRYALPHIAYVFFQFLRGALRGRANNVLKGKVDALRLWPAMRSGRGPVRVSTRTLHRYLRGRFLDAQQIPTAREQAVQEHAI